MRRLLMVFLAWTTLLAWGQQAPIAAAHKIQVLIVTGRDDHDWRGVTPLMRQYLDAAGIFETRTAEEFRDAGPESLKGYDVVVLVYSDRSDKIPFAPWTDRSKQTLLDFVHSGKGLVVYHHTSTAFDDWPEFAKLRGGAYGHKSQHSDLHDYTVTFVDRDHPITRGLASSFVQPHDELYASMVMQPEGTYHVLATAWDDPAVYNGKSKVPLTPGGKNEPLMWTVDGEGGRVFATMIGHNVPAVESAGFRVTFTRGVEWAATGAVTQPVPPELAPAH